MSKKTVIAIIALIVAILISIFSISALTNSQLSSKTPDLNSTLPIINPTNQPTLQPTNQPLVQIYTGLLVSFSYTTSQTNGVESTQLVFTNKTFNYAGYISLENDCIYNVTFCDNNPNQALSIIKVDLVTGLMGSAEQVSITNVAYPDANTIQVMVQNSGGAQTSVTNAFINGVATNAFPAVPIEKSTSTTITFTAGSFAGSASDPFPLRSGTSYTIKLFTAKGTSVISSSTTYNP